MADVAQLVRALVCGTRCREFESLHPPHFTKACLVQAFLLLKFLPVLTGIFYPVKIFYKIKV